MWRNDESAVSALAIVKLGDAIGSAEAVIGIRLVVAATNWLKTLAVLAGEAQPGHAHTPAGPRTARPGGWLTPQTLIANRAGGSAAGLTCSDRIGFPGGGSHR